MNENHIRALWMVISATLSFVGSGCSRVSHSDFVLKEVSYDQQDEEERDKKWNASQIAIDCSWEVERRKNKKWDARWVAERCRDEVVRRERKKWEAYWLIEHDKKLKARRLAEECRDELARRENKKWRAGRLAFYCSCEVSRKENKKWNARWVANHCRDEVTRRRRKAYQKLDQILQGGSRPLGLSGTDRDRVYNMIRENRSTERICTIMGCTSEQVNYARSLRQTWEKSIFLGRTKKLTEKEGSIRMFSSMNYPMYRSEKDRDEAHDAMMGCSTVAAIRTLASTNPNLENTIKAQRIYELVDYFTKRQRAKTKDMMYKKLLSGNWSIDRCIDSLDASFTSDEVKRLKTLFCNPAFPIEVMEHVMQYDEDLYYLPQRLKPRIY